MKIEVQTTQTARPIGWRDHLVGLALCTGYVALLLGTAGDLAMARDESFYVGAADSYGEWLTLLVHDRAAALQEPTIDRYWQVNSEHPALMKTLFALSHLAQEKWHVFSRPSDAYRFPGMLCAGLLLWLLYVFGARAHSRTAGAFAAAAFALMPRPFYNAHLDCFDLPITFFITVVVYCYWRSLTSWRWAILAGLAYGLALATKHNAWFVPGMLLVHWLWMLAWELRARRRGEAKRVSLVPWWLLAMATLSPLVFWGSWPWIWHDTIARVGAYGGFHLHHEYYNMEYFGRNWFWPPFPRSYAFVMTAFTVPTTTLVLALAGLARRARALLPPPLAERWLPSRTPTADARCTDVLLFGALAQPYAPFLLATTPIFGGTKHWMPAYPFLALFAGIAFTHVVHALRPLVTGRDARLRLVLRAACAALLLAPAFVQTEHSHPFGLSDYGFLAGGVPGGARHGMNRQFWGFTTGGVAPFLREHLPRGGTVWPCDTTWASWQMMQADGMLPPDIRASGDFVHADYILVHHEKHFAEVDFQAWVAFGSVRPAYVLTQDGVPIVSVYANPSRR